jgi:hypothetical protein
MAAIILGNVTIQGVTFASGDVNNYVLTSTGAGDEIKGENNLTFSGSTLTLTGNANISGLTTIGGTLGIGGATTIGGNTAITGTLSASALPASGTYNIVNYNTDTGALSYNASPGNNTTFLRADGAWVAPTGSGDVTIASGDTIGYHMYSSGVGNELKGSSQLQWNNTYGFTSLSSNATRIGKGGIGTAAGPTLDPKFVNYGTESSDSTGFADDVTIESGTSIDYSSYNAKPYLGGGSTTLNKVIGVKNIPYVTRTPAGGSIIGLYHAPVFNSGSGFITYNYGLEFRDHTGGGTVANVAGVKIGDLANGSTMNVAMLVGDTDIDHELIRVNVTGAPKFLWDESEDRFDFSKPVIADKSMYVETKTVDFSEDGVPGDVMVLPADAVIWDIQVSVDTGFNDATASVLDIGVTGSTTLFYNNEDISSVGFVTGPVTGTPYKAAAPITVVYQWDGTAGGATVGSATIYVRYSRH